MLDHAQLLAQLQKATDQLFVDTSSQIAEIRALWRKIAADPLMVHKLKTVTAQWPLPSWDGTLEDTTLVDRSCKDYRVFSIDGSQIYPDKHQGTNCFLINTGLVDITYGKNSQNSTIKLNNKPQLFVDSNESADDSFIFSTELVNCRRQEFELQQAVEYARALPSCEEQKVFLFDGSLIFWHLDSKDLQLKQTFLSRYLMSLHQLYELKMPLAGYISLPKSKELVNIIRVALDSKIIPSESEINCDFVVDSTIAHFFLEPGHRTIVFKNNTSISNDYPDHLRPYFFYLHVGNEIARIEVPAWIARDEQQVNALSSIILDQSEKGRGYPVALAEAHEQAVIKGPDREFFYHLIYKLGFENKQKFLLSQKSIKKRGIGI